MCALLGTSCLRWTWGRPVPLGAFLSYEVTFRTSQTLWEDTNSLTDGEDDLGQNLSIFNKSKVSCLFWGRDRCWSAQASIIITRYHRFLDIRICWWWWLEQQKFIFSLFWRLEVQDQGAFRVGFQQGFSSWLVDSLLLGSSHGLPVCAPEIEISGCSSSSYKNANPIGLGPYPYNMTDY